MYQHGHALPCKLENNGHGLEFLRYLILSLVSALDTNKITSQINIRYLTVT